MTPDMKESIIRNISALKDACRKSHSGGPGGAAICVCGAGGGGSSACGALGLIESIFRYSKIIPCDEKQSEIIELFKEYL